MSEDFRAVLRAELQHLRQAVWSRDGLLVCLSAALPAAMYYHRRLGIFPVAYERFEWFAVAFTLFLVVPLSVTVFGFRESPREYGLWLGEPKVWVRYVVPYAVVVLPAVVIASRLPEFRAYYPQWPPARQGGWLLVGYEAGFLAYFVAWEFFFRGFLLFGLARRWGAVAIPLQTVPFTLAHLGKPELEVFSAIIAGLALGLMAYRGRSILPCAALHWLCAVVMDLGVIYG